MELSINDGTVYKIGLCGGGKVSLHKHGKILLYHNKIMNEKI